LQHRVLLRRFGRLALCTIVALTTWSATLAAQELAPIEGNHLNYVPFTTELPEDQTLQLAVIMALRHRDQLQQLLDDLQDRDSPSYHRWLTPQQFARRFGPAAGQVQAVTDWLRSRGLRVTRIDPIARTILFAGRYQEVKAALQTQIFGDGLNYGNLTDPQVPAALAPTIVLIEGLYSSTPEPTQTDVYVAKCTVPSKCNTVPHFGPGDLYTFYDETPVLQSGNLGTGPNDCVALPEDGSFNSAALSMFTTQFAAALPSPRRMPPITYSVAPIPDGKSAPPLPSDAEPSLDIEWVHAVSPNTPIRIYYTNGPNHYLGAIQQAVDDDLCGVISSSVEGTCEPVTTIRALNDIEAQAACQGQTIFKSSGDYGSQWYCGSPVPAALPNQQAYSQRHCSKESAKGYLDSNLEVYQPSIDEEAASSSVTVVGGTQFTPSYSAAPAGKDLNNVEQGLETTWNGNATPTPAPSSAPGCPTPTPTPNTGVEDCPVKDATGGGPSVIFRKPAWQVGTGVPDDGARDIPDVAMGANGDEKPGFFVAAQTARCGAAGDGPTFLVVGGTSIATPMWAGISRLIADAQGVTRLGNINARLYELGNLHSGDSGLHDITAGNNNDNGITGYSAATGYDLVTGWGSPDIAKLVGAFPGAVATVVPAVTTVPAGASAAAGAIIVSNTTSGPLYMNSVTIDIGNPAIFGSLTMTTTVGGNPPQVRTASPSPSVLFAFSPPVAIPSGGKATLALGGLTTAQIASNRKLLIAGWAIGKDRCGAQSNGQRILLWLACFVLVFTWPLLGALQWRMLYTISALILLGLPILAASCGGNSTPTPTPSLTATAMPTPATPTAAPPTPTPATPTPATPTPATPTPTAAPTPGPAASSEQTLPQEVTCWTGICPAINLDDGNGGIIEVSGLPATLGTVTVHY
jgi:subtilase family serine protease